MASDHQLDSVVREFLVESHENLDQLDRDLVALEQDPGNKDRLSSIFRMIHTIKGTCGFFGFSKLERVTHVGENLLVKLRDGVLLLNEERTTGLLFLIDAIRSMLAAIEATGQDGDEPFDLLIEQLTRLQEQSPATQEEVEVTATVEEASVDSGPKNIGEALIQLGKAKPEHVLDAIKQQISGDPLRLGEILVEKGVVQMQDVREAVKVINEHKQASVADANIRVDVHLLDRLMNLVGELVLARNQVLRFSNQINDPLFQSTTQRLNLITTELQEGVMKTRMQPISSIWNRYPRVVRDLAAQCGKHVRIEMEGQETELDKTIIEAIKDPLTHLVRNTVDHGIEVSEVRRERNKPTEGLLKLKAYHQGGQVNIEIMDDGGGINPERVKAKAIEKRLIDAERASRMTDHEAMQLIFLPGFSTAEKVTNVSGRGVGMDVVKTNVEKIGGSIDIQSQHTEGTTIRIKIPLTLAIIPALIVATGENRFAIPQSSLLELVRIEGANVQRALERVHGALVYRLRGCLLPLVFLNHELELPGQSSGDPEDINIVVLQADDRLFGLVVDHVHDTQEIVVKPLSKHFKGLPVYAGATVLGDGTIALILDVQGLAQRGGVLGAGRDRTNAEDPKQSQQQIAARKVLLCRVGGRQRVAIDLSTVTRLEEIPARSIEFSSGQEVIQYRGDILQLLRLSDILGIPAAEDTQEMLPVIVYTSHNHAVGLIVHEIIDVIEAMVDLHSTDHSERNLGSLVLQGRVTDLVDLSAVIDPIIAQQDGLAVR